MDSHEALTQACAAVRATIETAPAADLAAPTPCRDFDLRGLVDHFAGTSSAMARAGRREPLDADDPWGSRTRVADGAWAGVLASNVDAVATAWARPGAWDGVVDTGAEMPAGMVGDTALLEVLLHGWDVARATGGHLEVSIGLAEALLDRASATAELGRQMEAYGPEVPVPADAPALDRALGVTGRDPDWAPPR